MKTFLSASLLVGAVLATVAYFSSPDAMSAEMLEQLEQVAEVIVSNVFNG